MTSPQKMTSPVVHLSRGKYKHAAFVGRGEVIKGYGDIATANKKCIASNLYKSIVRSRLEYCIQACRPHQKKDIGKLERVQRRATQLIPELRILSYEDRAQQC